MPNNIEGKPARLSKLEQYWQDSSQQVCFEEQDSGYWAVWLDGFFADFEIKEIAKALKAANKAGRL